MSHDLLSCLAVPVGSFVLPVLYARRARSLFPLSFLSF